MSKNTNQNRDLSVLNPPIKKIAELWLQECKDNNLNVLIIETKRTKERQYYLYGQGRTQKDLINVGIPVAYANPKGKKVTWTLNSRHIGGNAFDFVPLTKKGVPDWNDLKTFNEAGKIAESLGATWGGNWKTPDKPHIEFTGNINSIVKPTIDNDVVKSAKVLTNKLFELKIINSKEYWFNCATGGISTNPTNLVNLVINYLTVFSIPKRSNNIVTLVSILRANNLITDINLWNQYLSGKIKIKPNVLRALFVNLIRGK